MAPTDQIDLVRCLGAGKRLLGRMQCTVETLHQHAIPARQVPQPPNLSLRISFLQPRAQSRLIVLLPGISTSVGSVAPVAGLAAAFRQLEFDAVHTQQPVRFRPACGCVYRWIKTQSACSRTGAVAYTDLLADPGPQTRRARKRQVCHHSPLRGSRPSVTCALLSASRREGRERGSSCTNSERNSCRMIQAKS